eukprot:scaffold2134_cov110-Isochrysis_galbana.AAC.1
MGATDVSRTDARPHAAPSIVVHSLLMTDILHTLWRDGACAGAPPHTSGVSGMGIAAAGFVFVLVLSCESHR